MIEPGKVFRFTLDRITQTADGAVVGWEIPSDLPYFEGHFPGNPVFPAVALVEASLECLRQAKGVQGSLKEIRSGKFTGLLQPSMKVAIHLTLEKDQWRVVWKAFKTEGEAVMAELVLLF